MSAASDALKDLPIPTVTEEDLLAFHAKHFPHIQCPVRLPTYLALDGEEEAEEEYDDGLGYYEDGVKRTLTDEQIAMFRHSEIQRLLRARELQREAEEDAGLQAVVEEESLPRQTEVQVPPHRTVDLQVQAYTDAPSLARDDLAQSSQLKATRKSKNKKRKRAQDEDEWTHRRVAREQDDVHAETIELDY